MKQREPICEIRSGEVYIYTATHPAGCYGCRYRVLFVVTDVPSYQEKVCVEALQGPDQGKKFTCSPWNFAKRYTHESEWEGS